MHAPDPATPIDETLSALDDLVRAGKVRYLGHSNFTGWQIADADWTARTHGRTPFVSAQNHYNLLDRDVETEVVRRLRAVRPRAAAVLPAGQRPAHRQVPARGRRRRRAAGSPRTGTRRRLAHAPWDTIEALAAFARRAACRLLDVAIGGLAAQPAVTSVIAGCHQAGANPRKCRGRRSGSRRTPIWKSCGRSPIEQ